MHPGQPRLAVGVMAAALLIACAAPASTPSPAPGAGSTAGGATAVPARRTINLGIVAASALLWPLYVGIDEGFFDREGLDVETIITSNAAEAMNAMLGGSVDVNAISTDAVVLAQARGADVIAVAALTNRPPYSLLVQPELTRVADLRGKTLGVSGLGTGDVVFLTPLLQHYGLAPGEYDLVVAGGSRTRVAAMTARQIDGTQMPPPDSYILEDAGKKRLAEANEGLSEFQYQVLAVTRGWAQGNEATVVRFLRAYSGALDWLYDAGNKERAIGGLRERMQLSEDYATRTYGQWIEQEQLFAHKGQPTVPGLQAMEDTMLTTGTATAPLPARDRYIDLHYLEAAGRP